MMIKIKIITGSTRPGRFNIQPAIWIYNLAKENKNIEVELLDLVKINLPFLDEVITPMHGQYSKEHTKNWAKIIDVADGFIFVTPEYNHSFSPVFKNAIDYLFKEWHYKPVSFVSYGSLAGGSRAVEHLRGVVAELKMYDLREQILLPNYWDNLNDKGQYKFTEAQVKLANQILNDLTFWAGEMKSSRIKLTQAK